MAVLKKKPPYSSWTSWLDILLLSFTGWLQTRSCWAELSPCQAIVMPGQTLNSSPSSWHNISLLNIAALKVSSHMREKSRKSWEALSSEHQAFHSRDRRSVPLLGMGNDETSSLPCKRDFFCQLVKHALKLKQFFLLFILDKIIHAHTTWI